MKMGREGFNVHMSILLVTMLLMTTGLIAVYSASGSLSGNERRIRAQHHNQMLDDKYHDTGYLKRQASGAAMGLVAMLFFYHFDYRRLKRWSFWIMAGCFVCCALVWAPGLGFGSNGSHRWLNLKFGLFQSSEFAKVGLIIYMAKMLDDRHRYIKSFFSGVLPAMVVTGAFALIIVVEPDFGAAFVLVSVIFGMWVCGEMRWLHMFGLLFAAVPAAVAAFVMEPYRMRRLFAFVSDDPETRMREGFQLYQSLIAIGTGGWQGLGLGMSMQKENYLNAAHTDFIFAIIAEELGFVRCSMIIGLFLALVCLGWWVALNTSDLFGSLLAVGITLNLFFGTAINMCVVLGLLPTKGLVLPFMSYGGSSILVMLGSMGILMNIARRQFALVGRHLIPVELPV